MQPKSARHLTPAPLVRATVEGVPADVHILGVPFDGTSTYRPGSRFGPNAMREAFLNVEIYSRLLGVDLETLSVEDLGNLRHTASVETMVEAVEETVRDVLAAGGVPAVLGGEHTITRASFGAMPPDTALLIVDAHLDLRDSYDDLPLMHATFLRRTLEQRPAARVVHVGTRAATREEWQVATAHGVILIEPDEVAAGDIAGRVRDALSGVPGVYVSIDLDGLDPAYAPGVANPEPGGLTSRQVLHCLAALRATEIRGFDVLELAPAYDAGGITAAAAARFLAELCCLVALQRGRASADR